MDKKPILYMMLGIPGSGKTSVSEYIADTTKAVHISSDQFRKHMFDSPDNITEIEHDQIYSMLDYIASQILKSGKSVIYDANLNRHVHRQEKYEICDKIGAEPKLIWVKTDEKVARLRATEQADLHPEHRPFGNMRIETFKRLCKQMEEPKQDEEAAVINGNDINQEEIAKILKSLD
jgi:predicted kinase